MLPTLCVGEERKIVFREWGRECPGCARRVVDELGRERVGRKRGVGVGVWERGRAERWMDGGREERERVVEEVRGWYGGGGGVDLRGGWG